jgi:integrase
VREDLAEDRKTKRGRAESRRDRNIRPLEEPSELQALVREAKAEGIVAEVFVLLLLDAGLRLGEARALTWEKIRWEGARSLRIDQNLPHGGSGDPEEPKSGRPRNVQLSKRLAAALRQLYEQRFRPSPEERVLAGVDANNFRRRDWRRICERAEIGHRKLKDLRDTYASQLLTCGVQLGYVSVQLGHSSPTVTADHYAKWCGTDYYRAPLTVEQGEVPADLLSRLEEAGEQPLPLACTG